MIYYNKTDISEVRSMIDGTYGVYKGEVHRIGTRNDGKISLYPNSESEIDDTYIDEYNTGRYHKIIEPSELSEVYRLSSFAMYKGYKTDIAREVGDEYDLWVTDYEIAKKLGFDRCDKMAYNLMVKKTDVDEVIVEKQPLKLREKPSPEPVTETKRSVSFVEKCFQSITSNLKGLFSNGGHNNG